MFVSWCVRPPARSVCEGFICAPPPAISGTPVGTGRGARRVADSLSCVMAFSVLATCLLGWQCCPHAATTRVLIRSSGSVVALAKASNIPKAAVKDAPVLAESFAELGCAAPLVEALAANFGIERPMETQLLSWQPLRNTQRDLVLIAEAGSGKTLAYLLPLIDKMLESQGKRSKPKQPLPEVRQSSTQSSTQTKIAKLKENFKVAPRTRQEKTARQQQEQQLAALERDEQSRMEQRRQVEQLERRLYVVVPNADLEAQVLRVARTICEGTSLRVSSASDVTSVKTAQVPHNATETANCNPTGRLAHQPPCPPAALPTSRLAHQPPWPPATLATSHLAHQPSCSPVACWHRW
jgi:hypothetical protein